MSGRSTSLQPRRSYDLYEIGEEAAKTLHHGYENNEIISSKVISGKPIDDIRGILTRRRVKFGDGSEYDVRSYEPKERRTDVAVTMTTPWLTEPGGFNSFMAETLVGLGYPVDLVSAERHRESRPNIVKSAHNQLAIADLTALEHGRDKNALRVVGVSRAAMIGLAMTSVADLHDWDIKYGDFIVPCFVESLKLKRDIGKLALSSLREVRSLRCAIEKSSQALRQYPGSISHSPMAWHNHLAAAFHLASGEMGRIIEHIPKDQNGSILAFKGDSLGQSGNWEKFVADDSHPNMKLDVIFGGAHLSCISQRTMRAFRERMNGQIKKDIALSPPLQLQ